MYVCIAELILVQVHILSDRYCYFCDHLCHGRQSSDCLYSSVIWIRDPCIVGQSSAVDIRV